MRISQELITVLPDTTLHEVSILLAGMRITMTQDEARLLSRELTGALGRLDGSDRVAADSYGPKSTTPAATPREYPPEEKERVSSGLRSILSKAS